MREQITTAAELLAAYAAGRGDFHGADLYDADLRGADLRGANLSDANLSGANLSGADLTGANLSAANLSAANLSAANLYDANLYAANLTGANLYDADLRGADLTDANLRGADLTDANLSAANLYDANLYAANLTGANLTGANLYDANLSAAKNPPVSSHDFIAEALRQRCKSLEDAPENDAAYEQWAVAGLVLVSRELCWLDFGYMATHRWTAETRRWIVDTLGHWPEYMTMLRRYGFVDDQTAGETNADGQQADAGGTPSPQEAAEAAEWMAPDDQDEQDESDRKRNARIDELQTMIDAMRPVVEAVAAAFIDHGNGRRDVNVYRLFPVALIEQARAFVAAHPRASESAGGDDER